MMISHVNEVTVRAGHTIAVAVEHEALRKNVHDYLVLPEADRFTVPILATILAQLISYHMSVARRIDPDFPRNLSKTLTVDQDPHCQQGAHSFHVGLTRLCTDVIMVLLPCFGRGGKARVLGVSSNSQRILIVDDDPAILGLVRAKLDGAGFDVVTATCGEEALELIHKQGLPHLAIVDINMPGMDGFQFCRQVQAYCDLPVILLTAVDEEETIIRGIEHYAEDYITKPFSPRELVARVQRVLRRIGDFGYTLDLVTQVDARLSVIFPHQQALINKQPVALTPTETKILYILMRNAGRTVTTDFLLRRVWPMDEVFEDALRVHVHRLRKKIEPPSSPLTYIVTERGMGYRFESCP